MPSPLRSLVVGVLVALGASGCTDGVSYIDEVVVESEINADLDFSQYSRFEIINPIDELYEEPPEELASVNLGILAGLEDEMTAAGLVRSDLDPQLLVSPYITIEPSQEFKEGVFGYYWGYDYSWAQVREHERGVLVVDVVDVGDPLDPEDDVLAYRSIAWGIEGDSQDSLRGVIRYALEDMFAEFPTN